MSYVGSREMKDRYAVAFQAAPAPMTAKCIMRDELVARGLPEARAVELVAAIVQRLAIYEYNIELVTD